jgi:hypothetical protein
MEYYRQWLPTCQGLDRGGTLGVQIACGEGLGAPRAAWDDPEGDGVSELGGTNLLPVCISERADGNEHGVPLHRVVCERLRTRLPISPHDLSWAADSRKGWI